MTTKRADRDGLSAKRLRARRVPLYSYLAFFFKTKKSETKGKKLSKGAKEALGASLKKKEKGKKGHTDMTEDFLDRLLRVLCAHRTHGKRAHANGKKKV